MENHGEGGSDVCRTAESAEKASPQPRCDGPCMVGVSAQNNDK